MKRIYHFTRFAFLIVVSQLMLGSCEDFVRVDPPRNALIRSTVFQDDATASAAVTAIYYQLQSSAFASGSLFSVTFLMSFSSDEQISHLTGPSSAVLPFEQFNTNTLSAENELVLTLWQDLYSCIYKCNAVLEGLDASQNVTAPLADRLEGEARFARAFCFFYLVNLWGDVPLVKTTDYRINSNIARTAATEVYTLMIEDLIRARKLLPEDYAFAGDERVRANAWAAAALLARAYLYAGDWENAAQQASDVIAHPELFTLRTSLAEVFNVNSTEAILQWWSNVRPPERAIFRFAGTPSYGSIRPEYINGFEAGDQRRTTWTSMTAAGYHRTLKYSSAADNPPTQYSTALRLAEQYLIRAEARAHLNLIAPAQEDINVIRLRAGLGPTVANDQASLLLAVEQERRSEFFNEWGHRWLDLTRTGRANAVLPPIKSSWIPSAVLLPIPEVELINNAALQGNQNPGY